MGKVFQLVILQPMYNVGRASFNIHLYSPRTIITWDSFIARLVNRNNRKILG